MPLNQEFSTPDEDPYGDEILYKDQMFRIGYIYLGSLAIELLIYVIYTVRIVYKFKQ